MTRKEPEVVTATYRIVTPMFIGDAEQKATGISPASVKGALRFWWRALNWGQIRKKFGSNEEGLCELHKQEGALFGSAADKGPGQAMFMLRVKQPKTRNVNDWPTSDSPSVYLGMGLRGSGSKKNNNLQPHRQAIQEGGDFNVEITFKSGAESRKQELLDTLKAFGYFGGLGGRSRRGFGSVSLEVLGETKINFSSESEYKSAIKKLLSQYHLIDSPVSDLPYTAFSKNSRFGFMDKKSTGRNVHGAIGARFKNYRGQLSDLPGVEKRVFGMPYSGASRREMDARRSSPLFFHIHPVANEYIGCALFLPSLFHYEADLKNVDYDLIHEFMQEIGEVSFDG